MDELPDFGKPWVYENGFYLTASTSRMAKMIAQYELFKLTLDVPGDVVECGVFKGASFARFAMFRDLLSTSVAKQLIGFDAFGPFPKTEHEEDKAYLQGFTDSAGDQSITEDMMMEVLRQKKCDDEVILVKGNICSTVPEFCQANPHLKISLLNLDTDVYEPAATILDHLYPRIVPGGVLILDDYGVFPGETQAVDEYFADEPVEIRKFPFGRTPSYVIKPK